nr:iron ABC transporter permease [Salsipaludibacter albus]
MFVWPVGTIIATGLTEAGAGGDALDVLLAPTTRRVLWFSTWQAVLSTVLTLAVGLPGAWLVARVDVPGRTLFRAAVTVPFVLPTVVVASAFTGLLGSGSPVMAWIAGLFGLDAPPRLTQTLAAVLLAHVFFNVAVVVRTVGGRWSNLDPRLVRAARSLGASPWQAFRTVTLPLLRPAITAASAITFLFTFTSFGIVLILGAPGMATLEVAIYRATAQLLDLPQASTLALLQVVAVAAALLVNARLGRDRAGSSGITTAAHRGLQRPRGLQWAGVGATVLLMAVVIGLPIAVLVERSLATADGHSLAWYRALADTDSVLAVAPWEAVRTSLVFAVAAAAVATVVGGAAAVAITRRRRSTWGRAFDLLLMLPLGVSAVTVGFGFLITLDTPPLDLRASPILVPLAQALVAIPFVVRILVPALEAIDDRLRQAAAVLGASPTGTWRHVDLPILFRSATVAAGFAFAISLGEFGATVFIARATSPTIPVAIYRLLGQPGAINLGRAMAMSCILMVVTIVVVAAVDRLRVADLGAF